MARHHPGRRDDELLLPGLNWAFLCKSKRTHLCLYRGVHDTFVYFI
jgi:hypothetical protein